MAAAGSQKRYVKNGCPGMRLFKSANDSQCLVQLTCASVDIHLKRHLAIARYIRVWGTYECIPHFDRPLLVGNGVEYLLRFSREATVSAGRQDARQDRLDVAGQSVFRFVVQCHSFQCMRIDPVDVD